MSNALADLRTVASEFLAGRVPFEELDGAVARAGEQPNVDEPEFRALWGHLELLLAERSNGHLNEAEFRGELATVVPISVVIGSGPVIRVLMGTSARSLTNQVGGLFPLLGAGTRVVAASG